MVVHEAVALEWYETLIVFCWRELLIKFGDHGVSKFSFNWILNWPRLLETAATAYLLEQISYYFLQNNGVKNTIGIFIFLFYVILHSHKDT